MLDLYSIFTDHGPVAGIIAALLFWNVTFVLRDWKTIGRLEKRIKQLEDEYRESISVQLARSQEALSLTASALDRNTRIVEKFLLND